MSLKRKEQHTMISTSTVTKNCQKMKGEGVIKEIVADGGSEKQIMQEPNGIFDDLFQDDDSEECVTNLDKKMCFRCTSCSP